MESPLKLVIDTNVFVESISPTSPYHRIFVALLEGDIQLLLSNEILFEYQEVLASRLGQRAFSLFLTFIEASPDVIYVDPSYRFHLIAADPDDNKFVDCAICAGADYLVTKDRDYDVLARMAVPQVRVLTSDMLLTMLESVLP